MNTFDESSNSKKSEAAPRPEHFEALIAYEDFAADLGARRFLDHVVQQIGAGLDLSVTFWRLDLLNEPAIYAQAVRKAAAADVVLLSLRGDRALSSAAKEWLAAWLVRRGEQGIGLCVLLDQAKRQTPTANDTLTYLKQATRRHSADLFAALLRGSGNIVDSSVEDLRHRADTTTHVLEEILHHSHAPPRWGLNE